jgi:hypothetical protein
MGMQITVQNGLTTIELDVESSDTIIGVKAKIKDQVGIALIKQQLTFNGTVLDNNSTLSDYNIQKNAILVLTLVLVGKRERQLAKLELAQTKRQAGGDTTKPYYRANNTYTVTQLPTQYQINDDNTNNVVNNTNEGGLVRGRPWATAQVYTGLTFTYGEATISFTLAGGVFYNVTCPYGAGGYPYGGDVVPVITMPGNQLTGGTTPANDIQWEYTVDVPGGAITGFTYRSGSPP